MRLIPALTLSCALCLPFLPSDSEAQIRAEPVTSASPQEKPEVAVSVEGPLSDITLVAESALAIRVDTQTVTYGKNIDEKRPVASTQKLLTALIIAESGELGMKNSYFVNAHGLTEEVQYSTARAMMRLANTAWNNETI